MTEEEYKDYLAARVLVEQKPVTYRLLSRAVKTDVNTAKWMLFEFHQKQNAKKPGSIHATYLITGTKRNTEQTNGHGGRTDDDVNMRSSPFMSSMPEPKEPAAESTRKLSIVLVREEELEKARAEFEDERSIHIYSLESGPIENLNVLSACNHEITTEHLDEDPMQRWRTYGSIHNPYIQRRTAKYAPPVPVVTAKSSAKPAAKPAPVPSTKEKGTTALVQTGSASEDNNSGQSTPQPSTGSSTLKRSDSKSGVKKDKTAGDIFKSFAKAKAKPKETAKSNESTPAPAEDDAMQGMSEDEGDADDEPEVKVDEEKNEAARKAREERAERLRKMMDDDDMPDAPAAVESQPEATLTDTADTPDASQSVTAPPPSTSENGRRRGRRRVTKQKKVKDEDGYLVTKEETVWESFSEDEPEPKKLKPAPSKPSSSAKGKPAGKKGQGSIASFFKKA
ncbi:hypothetical protein T440DRAFT_158272 [Plenodomus tracheiphilus IPT5]|uniref:DNA polymerase delta subunit 3 n=1 Tax=Plenodomus tracheiphilus IPT5 TaxID=1408161 RepID=A0A6A7BMB6_9PLEO|nr:hypothetical protein T440DRAFT_158272 [Plenodomus tracheiphilus IPT5]